MLGKRTVILIAALAFVADAGRSSVQAGNPLYQITISGVASGWSFSRAGYLGLASTIDRTNASRNGINRIEVGIVSGNPAVSPERGAIQFATNTGMLGAPSQLDITKVTVSGRKITIKMAPNIAFASSYAVFNVSSGLAADMYFITSGTIVLKLSRNLKSVRGSIKLVGRGALYGYASYSATFSGVRIR